MWTEDYRWHFDYVRLAWDTGFCFEKNKYPNLDKNKICLVDVDRVVRERDVASIERFIPTVVQYILESDQAEVLDTNFVKMFRMSQLSVEYLLFCKKYLDNTVVLLKKDLTKLKEENKELKLYTQELESHVSTLAKQNNLITTFKCEKCSKVFSTEGYLDSHVKRRHTEESKSSTNLETDVLQSEIKELKERINVAEKLLQEKDEKDEKTKAESIVDENKIRVEEIQEKFEKFKEKVENDLKILQIQKNFYEDKYSKLFDIVIQSNKENVSTTDAPQKLNATKEENIRSSEDIVVKIENTTQTDKESKDEKKLKMETVQDKNVYNFRESNGSSETLDEKREAEVDTIEQKILKLEENIESKITSSLNNIQTQMEAFWGRLSDMEVKREQILTAQKNHQDVFEQATRSTLERAESPLEVLQPLSGVSKPEIKPRMKFSKPNKISRKNKENAEKIRNELEKMYTKNEVKSVASARSVLEKKSPVKLGERTRNVMYDSSITSELETKSESNIVQIMPKKIYDNKPSTSTIGKRSISSMRSSLKSHESLDKFRYEISDILNDRLQEMGISPNWRGIPQKTFEKALTIVEHRASLMKKTYPEYDAIKKSIEKSLKKNKGLSKECTKRMSKINGSPSKQQNVINIRYRRVSNEMEPEPAPRSQTVTIKNRSLYEDTESDSIQANQPIESSQPLPAYSDVIDELKTTQKKLSDTDSDLTSLILPKDDIKDDKNDPQNKSKLKNYPSTGSLTKKKVLFDIETDESRVEEAFASQIAGSTTSVASLIQDKTQKTHKGENNDNDKKESSVSDFDFSEI